MSIDTNYILNVEANYIYGRRKGLSDFETEQMAQSTYSELKMISERFEAKKVVVVKQPPYHYPPEQYFCECGKQQKDTRKNRRDGCFCERCGQKLVWGNE
jgi:predicted SprT family Zn-dependent metalloprotease